MQIQGQYLPLVMVLGPTSNIGFFRRGLGQHQFHHQTPCAWGPRKISPLH
jgi:hypothetical protein